MLDPLLLLRLRLLGVLLLLRRGPRLLLRLRTRLLRLLNPLLLLRRGPCLLLMRRPRLLLRPRLLGLLGVLLLLRFSLFFALLLVLSIRGDNRSKKQKQGSGTGQSNKLHGDQLHYCHYCH